MPIHVLLAEHPATGDVLVFTETCDDPPQRPFPMPCWVTDCRCVEMFELRVVSLDTGRAALASSVVRRSRPLASSLSAEPAAGDRPESPGGAAGVSGGVLVDAKSWEVAPSRFTDEGHPIAAPEPVTAPVRVASDPGRFEIHPTSTWPGAPGDGFTWRLRDEHGDVLATGDTYASSADCRAAIGVALGALGVGGAATADIVEVEW